MKLSSFSLVFRRVFAPKRSFMLRKTLGLALAFSLTALAIFCVLFLFSRPDLDFAELKSPYTLHILRFTLYQALLSTLLSILPAFFLARALFYSDFAFKAAFLRLLYLSMAMPGVVLALSLISSYGKNSIFYKLSQGLGLDYSLYGLGGILLAHVFYNLALCSRIFLSSLECISSNERQIASQLGLSGFFRLQILERFYLQKAALSAFSLVFMLCLSSFSVVLLLGKGPATSTLEVAIYQALSYDYDPGKAAGLSLLQLTLCSAALLVVGALNFNFSPASSRALGYYPKLSKTQKCANALVILLGACFLLYPLINLALSAVFAPWLKALPNLIKPAATSLGVALGSSLLCISFALLLLFASLKLKPRQSTLVQASGMIILAIPSIVLSSFFFLLFAQLKSPYLAPSLVIFTNALIALPFALRLLKDPLSYFCARYEQLLVLLNKDKALFILKGIKPALLQTAGICAILSLGDFGIIAIFGSSEFSTLPMHLYKQLGAYRASEAVCTAALMLILSYLILKAFTRRAHD